MHVLIKRVRYNKAMAKDEFKDEYSEDIEDEDYAWVSFLTRRPRPLPGRARCRSSAPSLSRLRPGAD